MQTRRPCCLCSRSNSPCPLLFVESIEGRSCASPHRSFIAAVRCLIGRIRPRQQDSSARRPLATVLAYHCVGKRLADHRGPSHLSGLPCPVPSLLSRLLVCLHALPPPSLLTSLHEPVHLLSDGSNPVARPLRWPAASKIAASNRALPPRVSIHGPLLPPPAQPSYCCSSS